jgi:hypothetical protein
MEASDSAIPRNLKWRFWIFLAAAIIFIFWMKYYLAPFRSADIVKYEMAKTTESAALLIRHWTENGKIHSATRSIYIDFIFIIVYCLAISTACRYMSVLTRNNILIKAGFFFSYLIFLAGIFDVIENVAMLKSLQQKLTNSTISLAYKMAISKFSIILMTLFFIAVCFMFWLMSILPVKQTGWKRV